MRLSAEKDFNYYFITYFKIKYKIKYYFIYSIKWLSAIYKLITNIKEASISA